MRETLGLHGHTTAERMTPALFAALSGQPSDDAHLLLDAEGMILAAAGACKGVLGREAGALAGVALADLSAVDSSAQCRAWLAVADATGFDRRETRLHRPDGSFVDVELTLTKPAEGGPSVVCSLHDIAERRKQELTLRADAEGYRAVFDHALDAMLAVDDACCIIDLNHAARSLLNIAAADMRGAPFDTLLDADERDAFLAMWERVLEMGEERGSSRLRSRDGLARHVEYAVRAHYKLGHHLIVLRDVTARDELELQLRRAQKLEALGRLAGGVAHDFNNLLTAVLVSADVLLEDMPAEDSRMHDLQVIRDAANRASSLTRQLLSFGRQQWSAASSFDLHAVVLDSTRMLHRLIDQSIAIECDVGDGPYHVRADEGQLEQILLNLALNARDAMPDGGTLYFGLSHVDTMTGPVPAGTSLAPGHYIRLVVRDNGIGMDAEAQARLFEPFFTTKAGSGTGLGLPTVYGIVQQCGGSIHVESERLRGSTFTVYLPEAESPTSPRGVEAIIVPDSHLVGRLLVVDDDPDVRAVVARVLERSGHVVESATGAKDAIALVDGSTQPFDVLIADLSMPGMRGDALAAELRARMPSMRVIFISGDAVRDVSRIKTSDGRTVVLRKPFSTVELERQVQRALSTTS